MSRVASIIFDMSASARRLIAVLVALFLAVVAPVAATGSASAGGVSVQHSCPGGAVCAYEHKDFGGSSYTIYASSQGCYNFTGFGNRTSSVVNNTSFQIAYYWGYGCNENTCWLEDSSYSYRQNLANDTFTNCGITPNDRIGSFVLF